MGRPTKYSEEMLERFLDLAKDGASEDEIALELDVDPVTLDNWKAKHPEFLNAATRARKWRKVWWERAARKAGIGDTNGNASIIQFSLKNIAPDEYRDRQEIDQTVRNDVSSMTEEELNDHIQRLTRIAGLASGEGEASGEA